jgi:hypothetical protein
MPPPAVMSASALAVNGEIKSAGKVLSVDEISRNG